MLVKWPVSPPFRLGLGLGLRLGYSLPYSEGNSAQ